MSNTSTTYRGVIMVTSKGTGFVSLEDFVDDIFIERENLSYALNGDVVEIELKKEIPGERRKGVVLKVIEPAHEEFIGVVKEKETEGKDKYYFSPDNFKIHIRPILPEATTGDLGMKVVVKIKSWKNPLTDPVGEIVETLGKQGDHEAEMRAIIRSGGFSESFHEKIAEEAKEIYKNKDKIFDEAISDPKRRDMRSVKTMTIDPADAKDFDDALSFQILENGNYEIGVHIADVSHYVEEGGHIDMEARDRGTSIYLVDRVIPMLPEILSNDLCSLRPNEDRLAFSVVFEINENSEIVNEWYGQTVIHSNKRFTYKEAQDVLNDNEGEMFEELSIMMKLGRKLRKKRYKKGSIAFDQPEVKFELDENNVPISVFAKERLETMLMIEDFMLLANQSVATHIYKLCKDSGKSVAFIYRVHDLPDLNKIEELSIFLHALGYEFKTHNGVVKSQDINKLLKQIEGKPEENLIKTATIRSMAKAVYSTKNIGHFSLSFKFYTHFTSPIRRYPDLIAHRMLRRHLDGSNISGKEMAKYEKLSVQSSEREMEAVKAERDSIKYKQVEYMLNKVGQKFDGIVTGVADWGIYVAEKESLSEGMVKLSSLKGDFYTYQASKYRVKGNKSGKTFSLGDEVKMKLVSANLEEKQLNFELV